jgi:hypothetical protein
MGSTRSAVKLRECVYVAKTLKRGKILKLGLHQRSKISALRRGQKSQCRGFAVALPKTFCLGF